MRRNLLGTGQLSQKVGRAGIWTVIGFGSNNGLRLVSNLILSRLLSPEIFGLMALAQVFMTGINMMSDVGVRASVIRSTRGEDPEFLNTAWSVQIIRSAIVAAIACLIAWPVAQLYSEPVLFPLICVLSISAVLNGFQSISIARSNRKLMVKQLTLQALVARVITMLVTIFMAWQLQSVWALAFGVIVGASLHVLLSHVMLERFDHRLRLERNALGEIVKYGRWLLLATFLTFLGNRGQQALFGFVVPVEVIGLLTIASLLATTPTQLFTKLLNTVLFPSFAQLRRDRPEALPRALRKVRVFMIGLAFPMLFAVAFWAQDIIDLLYDDRYAAAGIILSFSALNGAVPLLSTTYQNMFLAEGRSDIHAAMMFIWASTTALGIFLGFMAFGLVGSLVGIGLATSVMFLINTTIAVRRGYATGLLDAVAFTIVVLAYIGMFWVLDIPPAYLSPELVGEIL